MGIASNIFWIMFGLLYILYQALKEHPNETISGVLIFVVVGGGIIAWHFIYHGLLDWNSAAGAVFGIASIVVFMTFMIRMWIKDDKKKQKVRDRYNEALRIAREEPIDEEELAKWEKGAWKTRSAYYNPNDKYGSERMKYRYAYDKSPWRDMIIDDYITSSRVYKIMAELDKRDEKDAENNK